MHLAFKYLDVNKNSSKIPMKWNIVEISSISIISIAPMTVTVISGITLMPIYIIDDKAGK